MDRLTKSAHFLTVRMTFTLEELCQLYICETVRLEEFPKGHGDTVDDEHNISSLDRWSVRDDHIDFRGHAASMRPGS